MVDADSPTPYRLPPVSAFVPAPAKAARLPSPVALRPRPLPPTSVEKPTAVAPDVFPYTPATSHLTSQLLPAVQRGYALAQRGALFAAQTEFVQVLRRVAQANDAASGTDEHSRALAAGLRALDEADDFVPAGIQLEADLDVRIVASSHRTPVLRDEPATAMPHQAVALYHRYAEQQLACCVAREQAGSMALHGLGNIYARLAERGDDDVQLARNAITMYSAALAARPDNHLAANELGVLLCRAGRPAEATRLFERTIDRAPNATAYHNLAVAQQKLGMAGQAAANEQEALRLAAWERATGAVSRRLGVEWVSPAEMARVAQPAPWTPTAHNAAASNVTSPPSAAAPSPATKSPWQRTVELAKSLPLPGARSSNDARHTAPDTRLARPLPTPTNQTQFR